MGAGSAAWTRAMPRHGEAARASRRAFLLVSALLFVVSSAVTVAWCASMSAMGEMAMPGGWAMSMAWVRMRDGTWLDVAAPLVGMWVVMMTAMMLPSLAPPLARERSESRSTVVAAAAYLFVWAALGVVVVPLGIAFAAVVMQSPGTARAVPIAVGLVVLFAGTFQFSKWKAHHLTCCRETHGSHPPPTNLRTAFGQGLRLSLHCIYCCFGFVAILLAFGLMDLRAMIVITAAITAERLAPNGERAARAIGAVVIAGGLILMARAVLLA
jgi:predicted metal-binding membrane protein